MKKKVLTEKEIEKGWILNNELKLALEEREILLDAQRELLVENSSIEERIRGLESLVDKRKGSKSDNKGNKSHDKLG